MVSVKWQGRTGNNLWQIAAAIGHADLCNEDYILTKWKYSQYFPNLSFIPEGTIKFGKFYNEPSFHYQSIRCQGDMELRGYFQSQKYWNHCEEKIRHAFTPSKDIQDWVTDHKPKGIVTGIHIRRDDYVSTMSHYYHNLFPEYYHRALDLIKDKGTIMVFSDDIPWCKENFKADIYSEGNEIQDLFLLASCTNIIMANSSFSWWSSYLGKANTISPRDWFKPIANHNTKDLYLKEWQIV